MITPQQVYDYLQKQDIKLEGTFYPQQERYKAADERAYKVIFLGREDVRTQKLFGEPAGSARFKLPSRIYVAAKGQLEDVVGNFIEGTIRADAKECKIEENIPLEYDGEELLKAYLILSRADIFLGRVRRRGFYRLWRYATYLMTVGVSYAKQKFKGGFTKYQRPEIWKMITLIGERREKIRNILKKIAKYSHMSTKKALNEIFFFLVYMLRNADIATAAKIAVFYELSEDEISLIAGDRRAKEIKESTTIPESSTFEIEKLYYPAVKKAKRIEGSSAVSYTHLTLPTN